MNERPHVPHDELEAELTRIVGRGRRRKARRATAAAATLAVLVVGGAVSVLRDTGNDSVVRTADRTTTSTSLLPDTPPVTGVTTSTTTAPPTQRPAFAVVVVDGERTHADGTKEQTSELVLVDGSSGRRLRTLYTAQGLTDVSLSPDGKHVYFVTALCGSGPVERVRVDGPADQKSETINDIASAEPVVSPDGRQLAYLGFGSCDGEEGGGGTLHVRDLATGVDRAVAAATGDWIMASPTWSADGTRLAIHVDHIADAHASEHTTAESFVVVLDPTKRQDALRAPRVTSPRAGFGFKHPTFLPDGSLFVIETPLGGRKDAPLLVVVEAEGGTTLRRVATGDPARSYRDTGADRTGNHLFYLSEPEGLGRGTELRVADRGERTTVLATDVRSADW